MSGRYRPFGAKPCIEYHVERWFVGGKVGRVEGGIDDVGENDVVAQLRKLGQETVLCEVEGVMLAVRR